MEPWGDCICIARVYLEECLHSFKCSTKTGLVYVLTKGAQDADRLTVCY